LWTRYSRPPQRSARAAAAHSASSGQQSSLRASERLSSFRSRPLPGG